MIFGIGTDIANVNRFERLSNNNKFIDRILTETEINDFLVSNSKSNFLAKRFSAKEAFSKALGVGIGKDFGFKSIEILKNHLNAPYINILDKKINYIKKSFISFADEKIGDEILVSCYIILES